ARVRGPFYTGSQNPDRDLARVGQTRENTVRFLHHAWRERVEQRVDFVWLRFRIGDPSGDANAFSLELARVTTKVRVHVATPRVRTVALRELDRVRIGNGKVRVRRDGVVEILQRFAISNRRIVVQPHVTEQIPHFGISRVPLRGNSCGRDRSFELAEIS